MDKPMPKPDLSKRYARNFNTVTEQDQKRLAGSCVAVVGLGGLGGGVCEMLARTGVGHLILIDGDVFDPSNLNRQLLSREDNLGRSKAKEAEIRIRAINSQVKTTLFAQFAAPENIVSMIRDANLVVDCLDTIGARFLVQNAARKLNIPLVSGAIAGVCGQVTVIYPEDPGFEVIYGRVPESDSKEEGHGERGIETVTGNLSFCAMFVASVQTSEAVKVITKKGEILRNKLLIADLMTNTMEVMDLS